MARDVRTWCVNHVPQGWREAQAGQAGDEFARFQRAWFRTLVDSGYAVPHWPRDWGGGFTVAEQAVIFRELALADAPCLVLHFMSVHHAAATLLAVGTEHQRRRHLQAILDGAVWCQGFSEPEAGSDLSALRTRARRSGDVYVVNGHKVWVSGAMEADWCLLLVRTAEPDAGSRGLSYLILDMRLAGVTVRPIRQNSGESHFCEIFLSDVEVPVTDRVGAEGDGWAVAQMTLDSERGATMVELAERMAVAFGWLGRRGGEPQEAGSSARDRLAVLASQIQGLRALTGRPASHGRTPATPAASAAINKLYYSELLQHVTEYGVELTGLSGQRSGKRTMSAGWLSGHWIDDFVRSWEWTIPGGTSEIQRNIIAERVLGLPREKRGA